jgi:signal transduction histidine kinase
MERAGLFLYDPTLRVVRPMGSAGVDPDLLDGVEGTLEETPVAQRALAEDSVVEISEGLERQVPPRYARFAGITTLTCTPVSASGRWLGVIFADRGGGRFRLTEEERQSMWTLGKLAALAASVERATNQREAARRLSERISLVQQIHERVIQRLFGLLLALGSEEELTAEQRAMCHDEVREVLRELRMALGGSLEPPTKHGTTPSVRRITERVSAHQEGLTVDWAEGAEVPAGIEPLAQSVLLEALRNAKKHAPDGNVAITIDSGDEAFVLEVVNDGVGASGMGAGLGLRMASLEALQHDAIVEFGPMPPDSWHVRLLVPTGDD